MRDRIDGVLAEGVNAGEVPGVVAAAASDSGILYEGAFGQRDIAAGPAMTLDTVFRIASMTKAITSVAAMQLVEAAKLTLDDPVPAIDPALSSPQVLDGFSAAGEPILRPARRPITLRHLLTHTAGFTYEMWNARMRRYVDATGTPMVMSGRVAALRRPLCFEPGERWEYGINIDWVGRIVEAVSDQSLDVYLRDHILEPLGMRDTGFVASPAQRARQALVHQRQADGSLEPQPLPEPFTPEFYAGGGGLVSTARDYLAFLQMLLQDGALGGTRILKPKTVAVMNRNHIGELQAGIMKTNAPALSNDVDFFPGMPVRWGLGYMINMQPGPNGRSTGSLTWAGLFNSYYWIDPGRRVTGVILMQILPFADSRAVALYGRFERGVYALVNGAAAG
jgi:CubicO group peptidase (beta-lactamase class C family)